MTLRKRLGRGLDALIPSPETADVPTGSVRDVPLKKIDLNPKQPRVNIDTEELDKLADSIRSSGVIQPVLLRPSGEMYELVVGERRIRAARKAGLDAVPAIVRDVPDDKMLELALVENLHRSDLDPIEKARGIRRMIAELELTQEEAGRRLGLQRSTVANALRLLELSEEIQQMVSRGTLSAGHARALLSVQDRERRAGLARRIVEKELSVRKAERLAADGGPAHRAGRIHEPSPNIVQLEHRLSEALGATVEVKPKRKGGKVVIHFTDNDDFERLYELIAGRSAIDYPRRIPA